VLADLTGVGVGAGGDQEPARLDVAERRRAVQRLDAHVVVGNRVRVGAGGEQDLDRTRPAEERREVQRSEAVGRYRMYSARIGVDDPAKSGGVAEGSEVEDVQLGTRVDERERGRAVAAIERRSNGRDFAFRAGHDIGDYRRLAWWHERKVRSAHTAHWWGW